MNKRLKKSISRYFFIRFFAGIMLYVLFLVFALGVSYLWCSERVWYEGEVSYFIVHILHEYWYVLFLGLMIIGCIVIAMINIRCIAQGISDIMQAVRDVNEENEVQIELPDYLADAQAQLTDIKNHVEWNKKTAQEAVQRKNDLIMYLAHDLKTPLTSTIGYLTLLHDEKEISKEIRDKYMGIALKKSLRLEELLNEFFKVAQSGDL